MRDAATPRAGGGGGIGEHDPEKEGTPGTLRDSPDGDDGGEHPDPPEEIPSLGRGHRRGGCHRRGGPAGGGGGGCGRGRGFHGRGHGHCHGRGRGHGHHHRGPPPAYNDGAGASPFDFRGLMQAFSNHPFAQQVREQVERARAAAAGRRDEEEEGYGEGGAFDADAETFVPPVDVFDGAGAWTVHVALPGAKKEDVGVSWDAAKSSLAISGVVYRPGDEAFLSGLVAGERKVGLFQRKVKLPPARSAEKEEVDEEGIVARMEDGVLIVVVPKAEKDWTEIKKVDVL
ncbi:HSP20-like chaperone [Phialemonium atrogriseum]|uniref:HSP20-like chaperone n=1 Tax=Phialemonium atrogriseum TaxID=1093897 RepID=A0AAJ0C6F5_9PEZI|nr:HSP20-like chaperone [Phialemonium atrogriseum]KAK1769564.1 HSP20-like chaperone [Phialemonium atrogriseum]